jgi:hypothetical protein
MEIAGISKEGFWLTAILVAVLWCLVVTNHVIVHRAEAESSRALRELKHLGLQNGAQQGRSPENPPSGVAASASRAISIPI